MKLAGLFIYPLKSARGISLRQARLTPRGLAHDRRFMLVDESGLFLTQRQLPQMARLATDIEGDRLRVTFGEMAPLEVPLMPTQGPFRSVRVWRDEVEALDVGDAAAAFFSAALGQSARLVYMPDIWQRAVDPTYAELGDTVSFADAFPYLLANESSLDDLNTRLARPVPMDRFRPNLVLSGAPAYAEDSWKQISIGAAVFELRKPCTRCAIITTDQETGERDPKEPLKTLAGYHTWQGKTAFGHNLLCRAGDELELGDSVVVLT